MIHDHGGGTETHVRALIAASRERWRHYLAIAVDDRWQVEEHRADGAVVTFDFERGPDESRGRVRRAASARSFGIALIHLHNISGCRDGHSGRACRAPGSRTATRCTISISRARRSRFSAPTGCTAAADRHGRLRALPRRAAGIRATSTSAAGATRHRALLAGAAFRDRAVALGRRRCSRATFPIAPCEVIAHGVAGRGARRRRPRVRTALALPDDDVPTVAVLGAIGPDKGARRLERLVALARERNAPGALRADRLSRCPARAWQSDDARFTVHGRYEPRDLPALLAHYRVALVLYPSAGPETFSYTLTEAWAAGRPVLVPPIGALAERVDGSGAGWVMEATEWRDESAMLDRIVELLDPQRSAALALAGERARRCPMRRSARWPTRRSRYTRLRWHVPPRGPRFAPFDRARVRDSLGYRPWPPPAFAPAGRRPRRPIRRSNGLRRAHCKRGARHSPYDRRSRAVSRHTAACIGRAQSALAAMSAAGPSQGANGSP